MRDSLEYQLGYYVGLYVFNTKLPTLSTDLIKSNKVIYVTASEGDRYREMENMWSEEYKTGNSEKSWSMLTRYRNELAKKYLPNPLECFIPRIKRTETFDEAKFIEAFRDCLWNSDLCWYKIETNDDVIVEWDKEKYITKITLTLGLLNEAT